MAQVIPETRRTPSSGTRAWASASRSGRPCLRPPSANLRIPQCQLRSVPRVLRNTEYSDVVAQTNSRLSLGPPKHTLETASGIKSLPRSEPSLAWQCTPSPADSHRLP